MVSSLSIPGNFVEYLKPWHFVAQIFGLLPYRIVEKTAGDFELTISSIGLIFSFALYFNFLYAFYFCSPNIDIFSHRMKKFINASDYVFYNLLGISFLLAHLFNSKKSFQTLKNILKVDASYQSLNITFPYKKLQKKFFLRLSVASMIMTVLYVGYYFICNADDSLLPIYVFINYAIIEEFRVFFVLKSSAILNAIRYRFIILNERLLKFSRHEIKPKILNQNEISKLRVIHDELCDVCEVFNKAESLPIIVSLGTMFMIIITNVFYTFSCWYTDTDYWKIRIIHTTLLLFHFGTIGICLIPGFAKISYEANRTGIIVYKTIKEGDTGPAVNELEMFSNQLLHRKVQFSALGFFPLDYSLIYSIGGTITTYLVILIQFETLTSSKSLNTTTEYDNSSY